MKTLPAESRSRRSMARPADRPTLRPSFAAGARLSTDTGSPWPAFTLTDGALESLKWTAVMAMTADHANKFLLHSAVEPLFDIGRLSMPLFAIVLGINLARPNALAMGVYRRTAWRLGAFGLLASLPFTLLGGAIVQGWPLNVMFTLLVACAVIASIDRGGIARLVAAPLLFIVGGALVEFWWPAVALSVAAWLTARGHRMLPAALWAGGFAGLQFINGNGWAVASLPIIALTALVAPRTPRLGRYFFYAYYPAHLGALWTLKGYIS